MTALCYHALLINFFLDVTAPKLFCYLYTQFSFKFELTAPP